MSGRSNESDRRYNILLTHAPIIFCIKVISITKIFFFSAEIQPSKSSIELLIVLVVNEVDELLRNLLFIQLGRKT